MRTARRDPITFEQATVTCPACNTILAIVESLADNATCVYLWKPDDPNRPSPCHGKGVTEWQAMNRYHTDCCDDYRQSVVDSYHWPDRNPGPVVETVDNEPVLDFTDDTQLALLEGAR